MIGNYIVDFYCHERRLVIEVDGSVHDTQVDDDQYRQEIIELRGLTVLRLQNHEVTNDLPTVLERILTAAGVPSPDSPTSNKFTSDSPSPLAERGPGGGVSPPAPATSLPSPSSPFLRKRGKGAGGIGVSP